MLNQDYREMLSALSDNGVNFIIVGAYALATHGYPRATGDIDIWVEASPENSEKVCAALLQFGAPPEHFDKSTFSRTGIILQLGVAPRRIDIITSIDGVTFTDAWKHRVDIEIGDLAIPVIGFNELIANKAATGREKDALDVTMLKQQNKDS